MICLSNDEVYWQADGFSVRAEIGSDDNRTEAAFWMGQIADEHEKTHQEVKDGRELLLGMWLCKFIEVRPGQFRISEADLTEDRFVPGIDQALTCARVQKRVCMMHSAPFTPPRWDQLVVVEKGVLGGRFPLEGVRYPSPDHMSGWWLSTNEYDGDIKNMKPTHLVHVIRARPKLAQFLALPFGFRMELRSDVTGNVWFDGSALDR